MSATSTFTGFGLSLQSVNALNNLTLKVTFTNDPLASSSSGANDALNKANYSILGAGSVSVINVSAVADDPQSFILSLSVPLTAGTWTVAVSSIQTASAVTLSAPTSLSFTVSSSIPAPAVSGGATNPSEEAALRQHISPTMAGKRYWEALIAAIAVGDSYLKQLAQDIFNQVFKSTASGKFLDRLAGNDGFKRPAGVGISDEVFRKLAIKVGAEKLTIQSFLQVLEIFYGADAIRATALSVAGPFNIQNNYQLFIDIDNRLVPVTFKSDDFAILGQATAKEIVAVINRAFSLNGISGWAEEYVSTDGNQYVKIYSGGAGLKGYVKIKGGQAQNILKFPTFISTTQNTGTQWQVATSATISGLAADRVRFTWTGVGSDPGLTLVAKGDYANIYGVFNIKNQGAFEIVKVTNTYFEVKNINGFAQTIAQAANDDIVFFTPTKSTVNSKTSRISLAAQGDPNRVDVLLAATAQAVAREIYEAAYLNQFNGLTLKQPLTISIGGITAPAGSTVTVTTPTAHSLAVNDKIFLESADPIFHSGVKTVASVPNGTSFTYSELTFGGSSTVTATLHYNTRDVDGKVYLRTQSAHAMSTGDQVLIEDLVANVKTLDGQKGHTVTTGAFLQTGRIMVKMADGRILVMGGTTTPKKCTIYNPLTDSFIAASDLNINRPSGHQAVLLNDGRVLVCGGSTNTAEVYDPTNDIWITVGNMSVSRTDHCICLLKDGSVLVAGGEATGTSEIYNPTTATWGTGATMNKCRRHYAAITKLDNDRVLVAGGEDAVGNTLVDCEIYCPSINTWIAVAPLNNNKELFKLVFIPKLGVSGKVYAIGGFRVGTGATNIVEEYDIASNSWSVKAPVPYIIQIYGAVLNSNNKIIILNGSQGGSSVNYVSLYDPELNSWKTLPNNAATSFGDAVYLDNGSVFVLSDGANADTVYYFENGISSAGGLNGFYQITSLGADKLSYQTDTRVATAVKYATSSKIYPVKAIQNPDHYGPYVLDTQNGPIITGISTTITQNIIKNSSYQILTVADCSAFPANGGYLAFSFGNDNAVYPVKYTTKASNTQLILDTSFVFPQNINSGASVILLNDTGIWNPDSPETLGLFYLTDSISGRIAASDCIDSIAGAGLKVDKTVMYPGDRGLGNEGQPVSGNKVADKVYVFGSEQEVLNNRGE